MSGVSLSGSKPPHLAFFKAIGGLGTRLAWEKRTMIQAAKAGVHLDGVAIFLIRCRLVSARRQGPVMLGGGCNGIKTDIT